MERINIFNYCALAILVIISVIMLLRGMLHNKRNRYFGYVVLLAIISVCFDIVCISMDNMADEFIEARYFFHNGYLVLHNLCVPMYIAYLVEQTDTWHRVKKRPVLVALVTLPYLCVLCCSLINPFNHKLFEIDHELNYVRGSWFFIFYISAAIYWICGFVYLIHFKKLFQRLQFWAMFCMFLAMPVAVAIQMLRPELVIEMFSQALGIIIIMLLIQRPEERRESVTGFGRLNTFEMDMQKAFCNEKPMHVLIIRICNYKSLNDMLGFQDTNDLLKAVSERIEDACGNLLQDIDSYYLQSGRFCLALGPDRLSRSEELANRLLEKLTFPFELRQMEINVVTQICLVCCPEDVSDLQTMLAFGTGMEWEDKSGNTIHRAKDLLQDGNCNMIRDIDLIIERALIKGNLSVYYQPIYSVKEGRFNSAEALLRLNDEEYGEISPNIFIPAAEKNGAIQRIGDFVLNEVFRFIASEEYKALNMEYVEVNLSVVQCMKADLAQEIIELLKKYDISPDQINLEITETATTYSQNIMMDNINALADAGIALSLDDFGTGYSNMQRVASLPLSIVKLDKDFANMSTDSKYEIVLRNMIRMIKDMNLKIVVEGIETAGLAEQFSQLECEYIQGFFYSKPLPKDEFVEFIRKENHQ